MAKYKEVFGFAKEKISNGLNLTQDMCNNISVKSTAVVKKNKTK